MGPKRVACDGEGGCMQVGGEWGRMGTRATASFSGGGRPLTLLALALVPHCPLTEGVHLAPSARFSSQGSRRRHRPHSSPASHEPQGRGGGLGTGGTDGGEGGEGGGEGGLGGEGGVEGGLGGMGGEGGSPGGIGGKKDACISQPVQPQRLTGRLGSGGGTHSAPCAALLYMPASSILTVRGLEDAVVVGCGSTAFTESSANTADFWPRRAKVRPIAHGKHVVARHIWALTRRDELEADTAFLTGVASVAGREGRRRGGRGRQSRARSTILAVRPVRAALVLRAWPSIITVAVARPIVASDDAGVVAEGLSDGLSDRQGGW
eukprot:scaffold288264_cov26-Tisochrysis_lutea.AAC.1